MIYTPSRYPRQAFTLILAIALLGIFAGILVHEFFMIFALVFWMQYTAMLTYLQFSKKKKLKPAKTFTELFLRPQLRFFVFEFLAVIGLLGILMYNWHHVGALVLVAWLWFSYNFYRHYRQFRKYE
jgi:hypothetical protein